MNGEFLVRAGPLTIAVSGAEGRTPTPATRVFGLLPTAAAGAAADLRIAFVPDLRMPSRAARPVGGHPLYAVPGGLAVSDHLGREAYLPLAALQTEPVLIDPDLDLHVLQTWVQLPLLRMALHHAGGALARCSVVDVAGRRIALVAPARVGKTRLLLALLRHGASLVGDDWVAVDGAGGVGAACRLMVVRDEARTDEGRHSVRGALVGRLRWLSARTARSRRLSLALAHVADLAWRWGQEVTDVSLALPGAHVADRLAALDEVILLETPVMPRPGTVSLDAAVEIVAAAGVAELPEQFVLEAVYRSVHPGTLSAGALPGRGDDLDCLRRAFQGARLRSLVYDGSAADATRITRLLMSADGSNPDGKGGDR